MKITEISDLQHVYQRLGLGGIGLQTASSEYDRDALLEGFFPKQLPSWNAPSFTPISQQLDEFQALKGMERQDKVRERRQELQAMSQWWLAQMHHTQYPLWERMTLFWHNHFTTSAQKVTWPALIYRQHSLLRTHALGNFATLLGEIYKDAAMLMYLDGGKNVESEPNENFARELLELFTLGQGHYSEQDIVNAAKAFTGWRYAMKQDKVVFQAKNHDDTDKTFLGETGRWGADDIIRIILKQPRTAVFIVGKLWQTFIAPELPDDATLERFATIFRNSQYEVKPVLLALFNSDAFWDKKNRGVFIKSPVDFTVGLLRELQLNEFSAYADLAKVNKGLNQELLYPPDVKGWRQGKEWLTNTTFVLRRSFISRINREYIDKQSRNNTALTHLNAAQLIERFLVVKPIESLDTNQNIDDVLLDLLNDPAYQVR